MAELIPYGLAESLIKRLASAAFREFGGIYGVMNELERLKNTVESIRNVLLDAEDKQEQNHAVKNWIRRLKDVLNFADNLLDEFVIEDLRHKSDVRQKKKVTKVFYSLSPNRIAFRYKMAHEIEKIRKIFNDVVDEMSKLNLSQNVMVVMQTDIIGRENNKKEIISLLRQHHRDHNVSLIAIVGIGGLGKTALAQLVYNDKEVENIFEKKIWVCVSKNFDVKTILKKILESLLNGKVDENLSLDNLQNNLRQNLSERKYLLVLDDIWNESHQKWIELRTYLMCGAKDSKILVTTRSKTVAQTMGVCDPYVLNGLTPEESWSLLKNIITYGNEAQAVNETLESIGMEIAEKCSGVPLAIRTLGGLLQGKSKQSEWNNVLQGDFWRLCQDENSIVPVLKLSYQNLSPQQRQCFAYCSIYPKDWEIEKDELIQLCIAQGYLDCSPEVELNEDIGNQFVKIFLTKSFFQDAKMDEDGDIYSFKMHDLIHDLAMQVAGIDCCSLDGDANKLVGRPMHVSFQRNAIGLLDSLDAIKLRTLVLLSSSPGWTGLNGEESSVISNFKYLCVLKLSDSSLSKLSGSIGKLKHLRCLNLYDCKVSIDFFKSISKLVCLQTLKLRVREITPWEFNVWRYDGIIYSNWLSSLTNIVEISLTCCEGLEFLPPLERLPFLKSLYISFLRVLKYIHYEEPILSEIFFPSLESLRLEDCSYLMGWCRTGDGIDSSQSHHRSFPPFPLLSQLSIEGCQRLTCMPTFPNRLFIIPVY
ncbi:putative P-loop containing nucleoside triphosphate hydrolase, leucine-rich repeat domain, L [Medicago truncatula]|uniref:Putative P-loop containing nucleoside triphosphate hydrolase, leucine-rich repeat domain, L n=1 Tax=Medicago truncatula TaxID=3880 RepID=A0A396GJR7_MEDTR|nr:disease resistance protein RGA2 [Medicago truncatula]XP_024628283.1 disease resistance protein RGA2 [Medicago truncatula]XP_039685505.1 disease resistance protein RGA2 [Medicago truncatula]XP_039685506.1 disease resistance protein RGA2 [Medicago truncatula]RHN38915.1 putative P-loop containing nucleoside triphosphate hydrolase, leucine-rich repeat domain, L [Medicago truncatula]